MEPEASPRVRLTTGLEAPSIVQEDPATYDPTSGSASLMAVDPKLLALVCGVVSDSLQAKGLRCSLPMWNQLVQDVYEAAEILAPHENVISFDRFKESLEQAAERGIIKHRLA